MSEKHTPGPWEVNDNEIIRKGVTKPTEENIAMVSYLRDGWQSNAHLIAAAPDMLEALQEAKQFIQNGIQFGYIIMPEKDDPATKTEDKIIKAIRKARGEEDVK